MARIALSIDDRNALICRGLICRSEIPCADEVGISERARVAPGIAIHEHSGAFVLYEVHLNGDVDRRGHRSHCMAALGAHNL